MPQPRSAPGWVITDNYVDEDLGTLRAGKEAGCFLVRRTAGDRWCLLVRKDYRKRSDRTYDALKALREAGAKVPFPVDEQEHSFTMQYMGTLNGAAPRLRRAARSIRCRSDLREADR